MASVKRALLIGFAGFMTAVAVLSADGRVSAFDGTSDVATNKVPLPIFKNPQAALRAGLEDFKSGDQRSGIEALKYAAAGGEPLARWKLAKMYADGDGVPQDDIKAYDYFSQIVANYDEDNPNPREAPIVSSAFVAVGVYSLTGIANTKVVPQPMRALEMFQYAATNFGDPNAQYNLARMYLDGVNGIIDKDVTRAAQWLHLAAEKGHVQSQALLGQLLFSGPDGLPPQRGLGLMWLTLAHDSAARSSKDKWINDLYNKVMAAASDSDKQVAALYLADLKKKQHP
ncbi:MAG TPA: tetratricopeptide repeat protein [Methylovirgula sp.]|nr:tetratricopeptide repeat protein [Methylovirgula sp.]